MPINITIIILLALGGIGTQPFEHAANSWQLELPVLVVCVSRREFKSHDDEGGDCYGSGNEEATDKRRRESHMRDEIAHFSLRNATGELSNYRMVKCDREAREALIVSIALGEQEKQSIVLPT